MKWSLLFMLLFNFCLKAQINQNIYRLNPLENLLTNETKELISRNIQDRPTVFLGEGVHFSGSDLLAKTEFVKYLVTEHGYRDIVFESDFFGLYFNHDKRNLFKFWAVSDQCAELMNFLKENNVTIWGIDNQMHSYYSHKNFSEKLSGFLTKNGIPIDKKFTNLTHLLIKNGYKINKVISDDDVQYLKSYTSELLSNEKIKSDIIWNQLLLSFASTIELYTVRDTNKDERRIAIRDRQMAKNLDFLVRQDLDKKFIVWLANGHMSKKDDESMKGKTMGAQFIKLNPQSSYHIAFGTVRIPPENNEKSIIRAAKSKNSILHLLPSASENYFMDALAIAPDFKNKKFSDERIFNFERKTDILNHFDALVFIANGIEVSYEQYDQSNERK